MGKSSRVKTAKQAISEMKKEQEARLLAEKKKKTKITIITSVICTVLVAAFIVIVAIIAVGRANGSYLRSKTVMSTENFSISGTTFNYFLNYEYQNFVNTEANNLAGYGLDVTMPLRDQETTDGKNWFDYMVGRTQSNLEEILRLCEKAKAEGMELSADELKQKDEYVKTLEEDAKKSDVTVDEYITTLYGEGIKIDDILEGLELSMLATKYYDQNFEQKTYTEDAINAYFNENKNTFLLVDYIYYTFTATQSNGLNKQEADNSLADAKAKANKLIAAKNPDEFKSILTQIIKDEGGSANDVEDTLANIEAKACTYDKDFPISQWSFGEGVKLYDTKIYENGNRIGAYMITKLPYRDEKKTATVRHILVAVNEDVTDAEAKKTAEDILDKYNKGNKSGEAFGELATKYTNDTASAATGGLYESFPQGQMVKEFDDWSFDSARKHGDTAIIKTSHGYHVMYFESKGLQAWQNSVIAAMKDSAYNKLFEELEKTYKVEFNKDVIDDMDTIVFRTSDPTAA